MKPMMICWPEEISAVVYAWIDSLREKKFIVRLEFFPTINVKKPQRFGAHAPKPLY